MSPGGGGGNGGGGELRIVGGGQLTLANCGGRIACAINDGIVDGGGGGGGGGGATVVDADGGGTHNITLLSCRFGGGIDLFGGGILKSFSVFSHLMASEFVINPTVSGAVFRSIGS